MKIGVVFGNPETTTGGNALKFYCVRAPRHPPHRRRSRTASRSVGNRTRVKVVKNKLAPPFREAEFDIRYGSGIVAAAELLDLGAERGLLEKSGAWFEIAGERLGPGRDKAADALRGNPALAGELEQKLRAAGAEDPVAPAPTQPEAAA